MNKIIISNYGSGIAVGIEGDENFLETQNNRFFNYGAISKNGDFHREGEKFGWFLSTEENMIRALAAEKFVRFQLDGRSKLFKKNPAAMEEMTMKDASEEYEKFERENFMARRTEVPLSICGVASNGRAEVWEDDFKPSK